MTELSFGNFYEDEPDSRTPSISQLSNADQKGKTARASGEVLDVRSKKPSRNDDYNLLFLFTGFIFAIMIIAIYLSSTPTAKKTVQATPIYTSAYANFIPLYKVNSVLASSLHNSTGAINYSNATGIELITGLPQGSVNASKESEYLSGNNTYQAPSILMNLYQFSNNSYAEAEYQGQLVHVRIYPAGSYTYSGAHYLIYHINSTKTSRYAWSVYGNDKNVNFIINVFANSTVKPVINQSQVLQLTNSQIDSMSHPQTNVT